MCRCLNKLLQNNACDRDILQDGTNDEALVAFPVPDSSPVYWIGHLSCQGRGQRIRPRFGGAGLPAVVNLGDTPSEHALAAEAGNYR